MCEARYSSDRPLEQERLLALAWSRRPPIPHRPPRTLRAQGFGLARRAKVTGTSAGTMMWTGQLVGGCVPCRSVELRLVCRRPVADLRVAVVAEGEPAGERAQDPARRGRHLRHLARRSRGGAGWPSGVVADWYSSRCRSRVSCWKASGLFHRAHVLGQPAEHPGGGVGRCVGGRRRGNRGARAVAGHHVRVARTAVPAWWVLPAMVAILLLVSVARFGHVRAR
jgi:hypothetical protein